LKEAPFPILDESILKLPVDLLEFIRENVKTVLDTKKKSSITIID